MGELFLRQLCAPFVAIPVFLLAHYVARVLSRLTPDGRIKRFLFKRRSNRCAFLERLDARIFALLRQLWRRRARGQ